MVFYNSGGGFRFNLSEWGGRVEWLPADRLPCPVCGDPTGDCVGDLPAPERVFGDEPIESLRHLQTFVVKEDVWVEKPITASRMTRVLKFRAGEVISREDAENFGLI